MSTIKDVCRLAQVSKSTVSRVLNDHPRVAEATKQKVLKVIDSIGYKPNSSAQALASKRTNSIGMLVGTLAGPYFSSLVSSTEGTLRKNGFHLIATSGQGSIKDEMDAVQFLLSKQVDGLIIHTGELPDQDLLDIVDKVPATIILNHQIDELANNCIGLDDELGGYLATKHLIEQGHTKIACITGPMSQNISRDRLHGYRRALEEHAIEYNSQFVVEGRLDLKNNRQAPRYLLDNNPDITAVFCLNDHVALGVYDELEARHLTVGDDVSVVGFDNSLVSEHVTPKLTTINFPTIEMGFLAANKILSLVKQQDYPIPQLLVPELVIRHSVKKIN
ncbi:LacI family DNA-binding transcriptional regulator [Agarivorans sp. MS3-6]|uniref:LacI family DNA-binding transcriptional regulator n=1 Tax=Agarivorans sp. TSD2052 TaxID=2937286 RepID=UPI00200C7E15|nr:LacI family DNA-binding transcriptional regulator [Agarivorans sp. TSD2052]UPW20300.1 LacI family transcriptional regulator [Agarivorans sp. TSD2052]